MASLDVFIPDIQAEVPDAISSVIRRATLKAVRDFCRETVSYQADLADLVLVASQAAYGVGVDANHLQPPADGEILYFVSGTQNGVPLTFRRKQDMQQFYGCGWELRTGSQVTVFYPIDESNVSFYPIPTDITFPVKLKAVLNISMVATTCPDFIANQHEETIVAGALARLYRQKSKPWYDDNEGLLKQAEFDSRLSEVAAKVQRGYSTTPRRVVPPPFGG